MIEEARRSFAAFVENIDRNARVVVFHDSDADGVSAGVVLQRALERSGYGDVLRRSTGRERDAWAPANRALLADLAPRAVFLLDLGSREDVLVEGAAVCVIDHHRPEGSPDGTLVISGYGWDPIPNTSLIAWEVCAAIADVADLDWIAAVGVLSDLGDKAPFRILTEVRKRYKLAHLKEVTTLVNASRRSARYDPEAAARVLLRYASPAEVLLSEGDPDVALLREARAEVQVAMNEAKKAAPVFSGNVALIRVSSPCQVHPVIAQIWRTRLPKYIVIVANDGYIPGRVNFSMRSASGINLLDFLRGIDLGRGEGSFGHGHDQATGGSLPVERWIQFLKKIGFAAPRE